MKKYHHPIKIVIADDHELIREGLSLILAKEPNISIMGIAANGQELVTLVQQHRPQVVLTDIVMPVMNGIEATQRIKDILPEIEVIALSMFDDQSMIVDILEAGAIGYLLKNADKSEILDAIQAVSEHEHYYCKAISIKLARYVSQSRTKQKAAVHFSEKQLEVIRYICMEFTTQEIGKELYLSKRTIDGYRSAILEKMNVRGTAGIVIYAIQHGLFTLQPDKVS